MTQDHHVGKMDAGTLALVRNIADAAAQEAVRQSQADNAKTLLAIGFDVTKPLECQDTMSALRKIATNLGTPDAVANAAWVARWRPRTEGLLGKIAAAAVVVVVTSATRNTWTMLSGFLPR